MNLIYVMRHAQSVVNLEHRITGRTFDGNLTPLGEAQAASAGEWLLDKGISKIFHSPFHVQPKLRESSVIDWAYRSYLMWT